MWHNRAWLPRPASLIGSGFDYREWELSSRFPRPVEVHSVIIRGIMFEVQVVLCFIAVESPTHVSSVLVDLGPMSVVSMVLRAYVLKQQTE